MSVSWQSAFDRMADQLRSEFREVARAEVTHAIAMLNTTQIAMTVGSPGVALTASTTEAWIPGLKIASGGQIAEIHMVSEVAGTVTMDLQVQRSYFDQAYAGRRSICNGNYLTFADAMTGGATNEAILYPLLDPSVGWSAVALEPDSLIYLYVLSATGVNVLQITMRLHTPSPAI